MDDLKEKECGVGNFHWSWVRTIKNGVPWYKNRFYPHNRWDGCGGTTSVRVCVTRAAIAINQKAICLFAFMPIPVKKPAGGYYAKRIIGYRKRMEYCCRGKKKNIRNWWMHYIWNLTGWRIQGWYRFNLYGKAHRSGFKGDAINQTMKAARILKTAPVPAQWHLTWIAGSPGSARIVWRKIF